MLSLVTSRLMPALIYRRNWTPVAKPRILEVSGYLADPEMKHRISDIWMQVESHLRLTSEI